MPPPRSKACSVTISPSAKRAATCSLTLNCPALYEAMAGLRGAGDKPFECTGTEEEVRSAIQAAGQHGTELPALAACLRAPAVQAVRPLDVVLKDWGQDDLLPAALQACVRRAAHL